MKSKSGAIKVSVWVREIPITEQVFWCITMILGIAISLALMIALWQFGVLGGVIIGWLTCRLMMA